MKNRLWIIAFLAALVLPIGAGLYYRAAHPDEDRQQIEEEENRRMAEVEWSKLFDSCQSIDDWYNDRAPLRGPLIRFYRQMNGSAENYFNDEIAVPLDRLIRTGSLKPEPVQPSDAETRPDVTEPDVTEAESSTDPAETAIVEIPTTAPEPSGEESTEAPATEPESSSAETTAPDGTDPDASASETTDPEATDPDSTDPDASSEETTPDESTEPESTEPTEPDPKADHDLELIRTAEADYEHWGYSDYRCRDCGQTFRLDVTEKLVDTTQMSPRIVGQGVIIGRRNWLFLSAARSVEYYKGTNLLADGDLATFANPLTQLQARCDKLGIKLIVVIAPNKEQVYSEYLPTYTVENEDKREPRLVRHLQGFGLTVLYPIEELKAGDLYHETYHRYDTHWTPYGAYIADYLIEKELGMEPADPFSLDLAGTEKTIKSGDLISLGNLSSGNYPPVEYFVPTPDEEYSLTRDDYSENGNVRRTASDNPNELSLVLIGDSFRVNMSDPLTHDFQKTLIVHRDYLSASMRDEILNADVLILEVVERFDIQLPGAVWKVLGMLPG